MLNSLRVSPANICRTLLVMALLLVGGCGSSEDRAQSYYERGMKLLSQAELCEGGHRIQERVAA